MTGAPAIAAIPDVCEVHGVGPVPEESGESASILIEVPHGATRARHFDAIRRRLRSRLPEDLREFFYVNTDVGAFECAKRVADAIVHPERHEGVGMLLGAAEERTALLPARRVWILRCLLPRTFVDCNRILSPPGGSKMTAAVPRYIRSPADRRELQALHESYLEVAALAYARVCRSGGTAIQLHTYAPREVHIDRIDENIVRALRRAYRPGIYEGWPERPAVDIISKDEQGSYLAPEGLVRAIRRSFTRAGIEVGENATYRLHPATTGHLRSTTYPGRVLCVELSRDRLADPFTPFEEMKIGAGKLAEMSAPLAAGCLLDLLRRNR